MDYKFLACGRRLCSISLVYSLWEINLTSIFDPNNWLIFISLFGQPICNIISCSLQEFPYVLLRSLQILREMSTSMFVQWKCSHIGHSMHLRPLWLGLISILFFNLLFIHKIGELFLEIIHFKLKKMFLQVFLNCVLQT